jgi:hypothetical protein
VKEWNGIYNSKASKFVLVSNVDGYRYRKEGRHYVIGNKSKVEHKPNELQQQARKNKSVFLPFDSKKFSFSNASSKEVLFHINLDEEEIITKENVRYFIKSRQQKSPSPFSTSKKASKTTKLRVIRTQC